MTLTTTERGDLAEDMLPVAARLSTIVHGDGGHEDVARVLGQLSDAEKTALIVVLAGLTDPDRPISTALGWVGFDENGIPTAAPGTDDPTTLRDLAEFDDLEPDPVDEVAVARFLMGFQIKLNKPERIEAVITGLNRGMSWHHLDELAGLNHGSTYQFFLREQKTAAMRGKPLGYVPPQSYRLSDEEVVAIRERAAAGETPSALAVEYGMASASMWNIIAGHRRRSAGGPIRQPSKGPSLNTQQFYAGRDTHLSDDTQAQIRERAAEGASVEELAREFKKNTTAVREYAAS